MRLKSKSPMSCHMVESHLSHFFKMELSLDLGVFSGVGPATIPQSTSSEQPNPFLSASRQNPLDTFCRRMVQRSYLFEREPAVFGKSGLRSPGPCKTRTAAAIGAIGTSTA